MDSFEDNLINEFKILIDDKNTNENDIQRFLEKNTELIPIPFMLNHGLHFNCVISKLAIGGGYITDFAYLTKSSDMWNLVLVELEDSKKKLFLKNNENIKFSSEFNNAYDQVMEWKAYINANKEQVLRTINILKIPFSENVVKIKYVLIIGRNKEKENNRRKTGMFAEKNSEDFRVMTYDSLISEYENKSNKTTKLILSQWREGFEVKFVPKEIYTSIFGNLRKDHLKVKDNHINELKDQDYQIDKWLEGKYLTVNHKYDDETFREKTSNEILKLASKRA
ncbi:Shedu immune nuclease family protein [Clostridium perfringens]|uniref:Shedu immune nuclease family protein n=1 Tax=Clostridium perfringens TaxID=1502 RepID=UPI0024BD39BA|nr:Shedu immune nuclease family protein [Clostridium perfringens]EGT0000574.1 DUF4263 domain-containing protein [Clostridium perfringens]